MPMRYRLRTLVLLTAVAPPTLGAAWGIYSLSPMLAILLEGGKGTCYFPKNQNVPFAPATARQQGNWRVFFVRG